MNNNPAQFLTEAESLKVDGALLSGPEKFLTRLTISSLRVLAIIAAEEQVAIADLTPEQIISWFEEDGKRRREEGIEAAVLKW